MKIIVSGGGTGGHIYPALALIREIKKQNNNATFLYIGTEKGLESNIVKRENIPFKTIEIAGFKRKVSTDNIKTIIKFLNSVKESKKIIKQFNPDIVIGTGGYVCGPVVYAAARLKVPTIIHEQNSVPGLTNKFLSKFSTKVAVCFDDAIKYFPKEKVVITGNPRASEVINYNCNYGKYNLDSNKKTVLIFGGSRGAEPINKAVLQSLSTIKQKKYQLIYVTGEVHYEKIKREIALIGKPHNVIVEPFINDMPELLACVDLVVSRSGATTLAELTALGMPSVLIPSPYVTNNHQEKNARALSESGAAKLLLQTELSPKNLIAAIDIVEDENKLKEMSLNSARLGMPDAAERMYNLMKNIVKFD